MRIIFHSFSSPIPTANEERLWNDGPRVASRLHVPHSNSAMSGAGWLFLAFTLDHAVCEPRSHVLR